MDTLLDTTLGHAVGATVLAIVAAVVGRLCRRPALTHGLWLLVLLKLVTPPLFRVPVSWPGASPAPAPLAAPFPPTAAVPVEEHLAAADTVDVVVPPPAVPLPRDSDPQSEPEPKRPAANELPSNPAAVEPARESPSSARTWMSVLAAVWLLGTATWSALALRRVRHFGRLLRFAEPAPDWLREEVRGLAARLGLRRVPPVWLVPGRLSPMLWAVGGAPRLLVPAELLVSLTAAQRATLLVHELAHLRRRDHWVRLLEMLVTALYWWHPVVWWARRELREAEEQCCDAWVVWALPGAGRTYATALLECLDFLSDAPAPLPIGASGLGHTEDLKRRVTMIMGGTTPRRLTWGGGLALFGLAALLLPAAFAQPPVRPPAGEAPPEARPGDKLNSPQDVAKARADVARLKKELVEQADRMRAAEERLRQAATRLGQLEGKGGKTQIRIIYLREGDGRGRTYVPSTEYRPVERPRLTAPADVFRPTPVPALRGEAGDRRVRPDGDRRIQDLERKLEDVLRQLNELKRNMRGPRPGEVRPPAPEGAPGPSAR